MQTPQSARKQALFSKQAIDEIGIPQFGLVAEEVAKVDSDLVVKDDSGKPYTVRYDAVNAMLLNEFLKEHRKVEEETTTIASQEKEITELKGAVATLQRTAHEQATQIQKVSAQMQATTANAPQLVSDQP